MLLIVSEHKAEIEPLLNCYPLQKHSNLLIYDNIIFFINYGKKSLDLGYTVSNILSDNKDIKVVLLFGFSGIVNDTLSVGDMFIAKRVKLLHKKQPVFNPIDMLCVDEFACVELVTLLDEYENDNEFLSLFGDSVDKESYFFAKAVKNSNRFGIILRVASDKNTKETIKNIKKEGFGYDKRKLKNFIDILSIIDKDDILFEIFKHTGIVKINILNGLKRLVNSKRYTFSMRQKLYKKIIINRRCDHKKTGEFGIFLESDIDLTSVKLDVQEKNVFRVDDYVGYFHNLKDRAAIIFANKKGELIRKTPNNYTPDNYYGYSILNAYNCIYDCSYCFLKGYFKSFNPVIFCNYQDYFAEIERIVHKDKKRPLYFYSGTFSDSLAMSNFSNFNEKLIDFFGNNFGDDIILEMRTKSNNIRSVLTTEPYSNVVIAFSLNPQSIIDEYEHLTPSLEKRIDAIRTLDASGHEIGLRIDPVFLDKLDEYREVLWKIGKIEHLHSVEIGFLRYDKEDYARMFKKCPYVLRGLVYDEGMYRYPKKQRDRALSIIKTFLDSFYLSME